MKKAYQKFLDFRFEVLLFALVMLLFNRIFFLNNEIYLNFIWPGNMVLLGFSSLLIFKERSLYVRILKNILFLGSTAIPFAFEWIVSSPNLSLLASIIYILYYLLIFIEVMRQINNAKTVNLSVIFGSVCGYLLLIVVALFSFIIVGILIPGSFSNIQYSDMLTLYGNLSYFSMITLTSIGYGDISPITESARLLASFYGIVGQFYMVAIVGIIISKYGNK